MNIQKIVTGELKVNCYIIEDEGEFMVVDPGDDADKILSITKRVDKIVLTHGHFDHTGAAQEIKSLTNAKIYIHKGDIEMLADARLNYSAIFGAPFKKVVADETLDGEIGIGGIKFKVIHTPGHSEGGVCLLHNDTLLSGDTLFYNGIGRYDFGDYNKLMSSISKLLELPDNTRVLPGHGPETTILNEKKNLL